MREDRAAWRSPARAGSGGFRHVATSGDTWSFYIFRPWAQPLAVGQVSRPALPQLGTIALETEPAAGSRHGGGDGSPRLGRSRSRDLPNVATSGDTARKSACATSTGVRHKNTLERLFSDEPLGRLRSRSETAHHHRHRARRCAFSPKKNPVLTRECCSPIKMSPFAPQ